MAYSSNARERAERLKVSKRTTQRLGLCCRIINVRQAAGQKRKTMRSPINFLIASEVRRLAFSSSARPSVTKATTTSVTSQNTSASDILGKRLGQATATIE